MQILEYFTQNWPALLVGCVFFFYLLSGLNIVDQWERRPLKRWGRYVRTLGPGITWAEPISNTSMGRISLRDRVDDLVERLQEDGEEEEKEEGGTAKPATLEGSVQTHDNIPVRFRALLTWRIREKGCEDFFLNVEDGETSLWRRSLTTISEAVGNTELDSILHDRQGLYRQIEGTLRQAVSAWAVEIIAVELKDVAIADAAIQEAISMKARAQKEAEAELARAKMQTQIAQQLKAAASEYDDEAWKLKGFETLLELCRSAQNNTIMVPTDLVQGIAKVLGK